MRKRQTSDTNRLMTRGQGLGGGYFPLLSSGSSFGMDLSKQQKAIIRGLMHASINQGWKDCWSDGSNDPNASCSNEMESKEDERRLIDFFLLSPIDFGNKVSIPSPHHLLFFYVRVCEWVWVTEIAVMTCFHNKTTSQWVYLLLETSGWLVFEDPQHLQDPGDDLLCLADFHRFNINLK